jgi:predicted DNA-binding transcriptional regulator AlpA
VSTSKLQDHLAYPPRALRAERAAAYVGMSKTTFLRLVHDGDMPPGIKIAGMIMWDRLDLDAAIEDWKTKADPDAGESDSWDLIEQQEQGK